MSQRTTRRKRKSIDKNVEVVVANNTYGTFVWESRNGETSIVLEEHGDDEFLTYGELRKLKKYLENMELVITEVNEDGVSIMDVARGLRIDDVYEEYFDLIEETDANEVDSEADIDINEFEDFILESDDDEFKQVLESKLRDVIISGSVELYKNQKLASHSKTRMIRDTRPKAERDTFWSDIEASQEQEEKGVFAIMDEEKTNMGVKNPNYTYFEEVYKAFLNTVDSYDFSAMDDDELSEVLYGYLDAGRVVFSTYITKDFYDDNVEEQRFNIKLSRVEINLLAKAMKLEWIREHRNSEELMRKAIGDRDYSATQGYQYLESLGKMESQLSREIESTINKIEYSDSDRYGDMK